MTAPAADVRVEVIPSVDARLARHVVHDERSWDYPALGSTGPLRPVAWARRGPVLDQGLANHGHGLGCCTMCAGFGALMTEPYATALHGRTFTLDDVVAGYSEETALDDRSIPGRWPPQDTGSAGLWMAKVLQRHGLVTGYRHAFGTAAALAALQAGPLCIGIAWLYSMFTPDASGTITVDPGYVPRGASSPVAGGHELIASAYQPDPAAPGGAWVWLDNSWGRQWGIGGRARVSVEGFDWLIRQRGDVIQLVVPGAGA